MHALHVMCVFFLSPSLCDTIIRWNIFKLGIMNIVCKPNNNANLSRTVDNVRTSFGVPTTELAIICHSN